MDHLGNEWGKLSCLGGEAFLIEYSSVLQRGHLSLDVHWRKSFREKGHLSHLSCGSDSLSPSHSLASIFLGEGLHSCENPLVSYSK